MTQQATVKWTRKAWDQYVEQVRDSIPEPEISAITLQQAMPPRVTFTCPFCLSMQSGMDIVQPEDGGAFTATWRECRHAVSVDGPVVGGHS